MWKKSVKKDENIKKKCSRRQAECESYMQKKKKDIIQRKVKEHESVRKM